MAGPWEQYAAPAAPAAPADAAPEGPWTAYQGAQPQPSAAPPAATGNDILRSAATGAQKGVGAVLGMPSDIWHALDRGFQYATTEGAAKLGLISPDQAEKMRAPLPGEEYNYGSDFFNKKISDANVAGGVNEPTPQPGLPGMHLPQTTAGQYAQAGTQGAVAALPFAASAAAALPTLAAGAGGGTGGVLGRDIGEKYGHPLIGEAVGGVAGGLAGQGLGTIATKGANALAGNYGELAQAYKDAGVPLNFTPNHSAAAYSSQSLGGSGRTLALAKQEVDAFGKSIGDTASGLGGSTSLQELGDVAQNQGKQWLTGFKANSNAIHGAVDSAVGQAAPVAPTATSQVLSDIAGKGGGNQAATTFLKSGLAKDMETIVSSAPGGTLPWQTVRALRSRVGEYLENPQLIADAGQAQAKRLYGALTQDLKTTAAASSNPDAARLFDLANNYTSKGHDFIDNVLAPIMSKDAPSAAQTILSSANRGDQMVGPLRQNIPGLADEIGAFKLRDMAAATAGKQNAAGNAISPASFLTDWNKLSPEAKSALYADPAVAKKIDALAKISENVKSRLALLNTSNTAPHGAVTAMALAALEGGKSGYDLYGIPGALAGAATGVGAIPAFNYGYSMLGANRPLARFMGAQGANAGYGPTVAAALNNRGLLAPPADPTGLLK